MKYRQLFPATEQRQKTIQGETAGFEIETNQAHQRRGRKYLRPIFWRPIRGLKNLFTRRPTVSPWATFSRASGTAARQITIGAMILFVAVGAMAQTKDLSDAEVQGQQLVQEILGQQPTENSTNTGVLRIRDDKGVRLEIPVECKTIVTATNWQTYYTANWTNKTEVLWVIHAGNGPNAYAHDTFYSAMGIPALGHLFTAPQEFSDAKTAVPFANSDFQLGDLGLEFFHWPGQKILKRETHRSRGCAVLESTNPHPSANGYSRVVSWIDNESLGIVEAYAYDAGGKELKDFYPKDFKKIAGQWQVQTLVMENVQTGSRSRLEFDLKK